MTRDHTPTLQGYTDIGNETLAFTAEGAEEAAAREQIQIERLARLLLLNNNFPLGSGWALGEDGRLSATLNLALDMEKIAKNKADLLAYDQGRAGEGPALSYIPRELSGRELLTGSARIALHKAENALNAIAVPLGSRPGAPFKPLRVEFGTGREPEVSVRLSLDAQDIDMKRAEKALAGQGAAR